MSSLKIVFLLVALFVPFRLQAEVVVPAGLYLSGGDSKVGVILCHGRGLDADGYVVGSLRLSLHAELGFHTLSLSMPDSRKPLAELHSDFSLAGQYIEQAIVFLKQEQGVETIILLGHSLGSRMASAWLATDQQGQVQGFVGVSMLNNGGSIFDCAANLQRVSLPILDILGTDNQFGDVDFGAQRRQRLSPLYSQIIIDGADHAFSDHDDELSTAVVDWLRLNFPR